LSLKLTHLNSLCYLGPMRVLSTLVCLSTRPNSWRPGRQWFELLLILQQLSQNIGDRRQMCMNQGSMTMDGQRILMIKGWLSNILWLKTWALNSIHCRNGKANIAMTSARTHQIQGMDGRYGTYCWCCRWILAC
jgi:hypothetical protein